MDIAANIASFIFSRKAKSIIQKALPASVCSRRHTQAYIIPASVRTSGRASGETTSASRYPRHQLHARYRSPAISRSLTSGELIN